MKSPNASLTSAERALNYADRFNAMYLSIALALAVCPILFCSCKSTDSSFSSKSSNNPYAQNEPKNEQEEAYYRDVYSGDWREQTGPAGMGKSIAKKSGSLQLPPHWEMRPDGARDLSDIRAESARRAVRKAETSNPYPLPPSAPTTPSVQDPVYSAAPVQPTYTAQMSYAPAASEPTVAQQYVEVEPQAYAQYAAQQQARQQSTQTVYATQQQANQTVPQSVLPTQTIVPQQVPAQQVPVQQVPAQQVPVQQVPTQQAYPQYTPSTYSSAAYGAPAEKTWVVRGQEAESAVVEMKKENVTPRVAEKAVVKLDESRAGGVAVKPVVIDPSIAIPYAGIRQPGVNPSAPLNADAPRSTHDEYVVTGGDSKDKVVSHEDWLVENLDPEDSAAHFDTTDGRILTEPSNKIFLYSPRFGAVRQVIAPIEGNHSATLDVASTTEGVQVKADALAVDVRSQDEKLLSATGTQEIAGATSAMAPTTGIGRIGVMEADGQLRLNQVLTSATVDSLGTEDSALMMEGAIAAQGWSEKTGVAVATDQMNAFSNVYIDGPATVYQVKDGTKTSKLRVVKIANKDSARPGEFVEFTLRFENIGDEPIGNVTILDNLSARLRYVDGTAKSSVAADFLADLSETGSLILRWEITEPLQPKEFGVVQFICKVQ